jgi:hypothetical protein
MDITSYLLGKNSAGEGGGGGSDLDWTALGFDNTPQDVLDIYKGINDDYDYSKEIQDTWIPKEDLSNMFANNITLKYMPLVDTSITTNMSQTFRSSELREIALLNTSNVTNMFRTFQGSKLTTIPLFDTKNVTNMQQTFMSINTLENVPLLNTSKVTNMVNMFSNDTALTDQSLDNILQMCIDATSYTGTKTLSTLGFISGNYPATRIQALSNYQDFIDAGWTIGY